MPPPVRYAFLQSNDENDGDNRDKGPTALCFLEEDTIIYPGDQPEPEKRPFSRSNTSSDEESDGDNEITGLSFDLPV